MVVRQNQLSSSGSDKNVRTRGLKLSMFTKIVFPGKHCLYRKLHILVEDPYFRNYGPLARYQFTKTSSQIFEGIHIDDFGPSKSILGSSLFQYKRRKCRKSKTAQN